MIPLSRCTGPKIFLVILFVTVLSAVSPWLLYGDNCYAQESEARFGLMLPLSGVAKPLGQELRQGIDMAVEEINSQRSGLLAPELKYHLEDTQCLDFEASRGAELILKTEGLKTIVGPVCESAIRAANQVRREIASVLIAPVTMSGQFDGEKVFRLWGDLSYIMGRLVTRVSDLLKVKSLTIVGVNIPYSESLAKKFAGHAKGTNIKLYPTVTSDMGAKDLNAALQNALKDQPEALFLALPPAAASMAFRELGRINPGGVKIIAAPGLFIPPSKDLPSSLDIYFPVGWHASLNTPESHAFVDAFKARYGDVPQSELPVWGYAAVLALANAMKQAPLTDPFLLSQALENGEVVTPAGKIQFDKRGFANMPVKLARRHGGAWTTLE